MIITREGICGKLVEMRLWEQGRGNGKAYGKLVFVPS